MPHPPATLSPLCFRLPALLLLPHTGQGNYLPNFLGGFCKSYQALIEFRGMPICCPENYAKFVAAECSVHLSSGLGMSTRALGSWKLSNLFSNWHYLKVKDFFHSTLNCKAVRHIEFNLFFLLRFPIKVILTSNNNKFGTLLYYTIIFILRKLIVFSRLYFPFILIFLSLFFCVCKFCYIFHFFLPFSFYTFL